VLLTVEVPDEPYVAADQRSQITHLGKGVHRVVVRYGFMEQPDVPRDLSRLADKGVPFDPMRTSYFIGRNSFVGPSFASWETSLFKKIKITERVNAEFRAEAFNVLNHTNFQLPGAGGATNMRTNSGTFGKSGGAFNPRNLQFGLKVSF